MKKTTILLATVTFMLFCCSFLAKSQTRVVCVGNSITAGWGLANSNTEAYPAQLGLLLGSGFVVKNCGASGTCMVKGDVNATYWNTQQFQDAKNFDPQIVLIKLGTNDADPPRWNAHKGEYYNDYVAMIAEFRKNGRNPRIFACFPVPTFGSVKAAQGANILNEVIPLIKKVVASQGVSFIDFNTPMLGYPNLFQDGIHPTAEGAKRVAQLAFNSIVGAAGKGGTYSLQNRNSNLYMDISGGGTADGDSIIQWTSNNGANQKFNLIEVSSGVYNIQSVSSGRYVDIFGGSIDNGAKCIQWGYTGGDNQRYCLLATDNGYYKLKATHSLKILDVNGASKTAGTKVIQWTDNNQINAQWKLIAVTKSSAIVKPEEINSNEIICFPNPATNMVTLTNISANQKITIFDINGRACVKVQSTNKIGNIDIDIRGLKPGTYFIKLENEPSKTLKLIKQ